MSYRADLTDLTDPAEQPDPPAALPPWFAIWLAASAALVFAMIILGGAVRLTGSGLSMVDWRPLTGWLPPLTAEQWQAVFTAYQRYPEYRLRNFGLTLEGFQFIFWMEYAHRLLGRVIGVIYGLPLIFCTWRGSLPRPLLLRLWLIFALGAAQGGLGWYMVQSGLVDLPQVSHYRLTAHLLLAAGIYVLLLRLLIGLNTSGKARNPRLAQAGWLLLAGLLLLIASAGLTAGLKAGLLYNTWPKMGGQWLPPGLWAGGLDNPVLVQFLHRWGAALMVIGLLGYAIAAARHSRGLERGLAFALGGLALAQFALGVATLLGQASPTLALPHQAGGIVLLSGFVALWSLHLPPPSRFPAGVRRSAPELPGPPSL